MPDDPVRDMSSQIFEPGAAVRSIQKTMDCYRFAYEEGGVDYGEQL